MNDQDHSLSLSDPDRSLVLSHLLVNFFKNLVSCQTSFTQKPCSTENLLTAISIRTSKIVTWKLFIIFTQVSFTA
jgi:hypothetical protein